jgi:hypothetical protein
MPAGEAKPLGTPKTSKKKSSKKVVDTPATSQVESSSVNENVVAHDAQQQNVPASGENVIMSENATVVTFNKSDKARKSSSVVFVAANGMRGSIRASKTLFGGEVPASISVTGEGFAAPKVKLTPEQRKEARKNAPKLTPAQKLAKLQERTAKLQAKIAAESAAPAAEPVAQ